MRAQRAVAYFGVAALVLSQASAAYAQSACSAGSDHFLNPFNKNSAHHRPIGTGATYAPGWAASSKDWLKAAHFTLNIGAPWGVTMIDTVETDPIVTVGGVAPCGRVSGLPVDIRLPVSGLITRIEVGASGCQDGNIVVHDKVSDEMHHLRQYNYNEGSPTAGQYRLVDTKGLGHGTRMGQRLGTSASGVAAPFGLLRGHETNTPGHAINHAMQIVLPRIAGCKIMLSRNIVLPATDRDGTATNTGNNTGNIPYGGLLALPPTVSLTSLGLSEPGLRLAQAIRDYGIYAVDGGGCNAGALRTDQEVNEATAKLLRADIKKFHRYIRLVTNNDVLGSPVAGGGEARAPNCAFDALPPVDPPPPPGNNNNA